MIRAVLLVAVIAALAGQVQAGLIGLSSTFPGVVYDINTTNGAATVRTTITTGEGASLTGLGALGGTVYATDIFDIDSPGFFVFGSIDLDTGAFTLINNQAGSSNWHGLAGDVANNRLYSVDLDNSNNLVSVTPDGTVTVVGPSTGVVGLAFDNVNGILYGVDGVELFTINTATGAATSIGSHGISNPSILGLAFDDLTGTLYLVNGGQFDSDLFTVNTTTGVASFVGLLGVANVDGLEFLPAPVPEPASMTLVGIAAVGISLGALRRRRANNSAAV